MKYQTVLTVLAAILVVASGCKEGGSSSRGRRKKPRGQESASRADKIRGSRSDSSSTAPGSGSKATPPLPEAAKRPVIESWADAHLGDWNGDGRLEVFLISEGTLFITSVSGKVLFTHPVGQRRLDLVQDTDGDGKDELFVSWRDGRDLFISVLDQDANEVRRFRTKGGLHKGKPDSGIRARALIDLDGDGRPELVASVASGYGWKPRGVYCFDFESGALRWKHLTGPGVTDVRFLDVNNDDVLDVVFGTYSPGNGNRETDGSDDVHCYVHAVSGKGGLLWLRQLGTHFTGTYPIIADLDGDGRKDILVRVEAGPDFRKEVGQLVRLDRRGCVTAHYDAGATVYSCVATDLDGDGRPEILATDRRGILSVLRPNLTLIRQVSVGKTIYGSIISRIQAVADVNQDGEPELVMTCCERKFVSGRNPRGDHGPRNVRRFHNIAVLVLGSDLGLKHRHEVARLWKQQRGHAVKVRDLDADGDLEVISLADDLKVFEFARPAASSLAPLHQKVGGHSSSLGEVRRELAELIESAIDTRRELLRAKLDSKAEDPTGQQVAADKRQQTVRNK